MESQTKSDAQVTITQMLKALDKGVASDVEKRLKKLSKKKTVKAPLPSNKSDQLERVTAYNEVNKEVSKWEPIVERNRKAEQLIFPLDETPDVLPPVAESLSFKIDDQDEFVKRVHSIVQSVQPEEEEVQKVSKAEQKYLKSVSAEEAKSRHQELQRMRVLLGTYAAKMRRQKSIKSKSYRRLLKQERIKHHMKTVVSDKDKLMDEIEKLHKLRAQERASLKHRNTGKWAKHAKFRAKFDEEARQAMIEQIGLSDRLRERPTDDSDESDFETDEDDVTDDESVGSDRESASQLETNEKEATKVVDLIESSEVVGKKSADSRKRKSADDDGGDGGGSDDSSDDDDDDEQRKLMSEAFADDDVVSEFKKAKQKLADEEQPKDVDLFLPGWGDWAGPGLKTNKRKRKKFVIKAKRVERRDEKLGNVIISEQADAALKDLMVKRLPRNVKNDEALVEKLSKPVAATFTSQTSHREATRPRIVTRMGARIEPINKKLLGTEAKKSWVL